MNHASKTTYLAWPRLAAAGLLLLSCAGCALIREDTPASPQLSADRIRIGQSLKLAREGWPEAQWWRRYGDPQLDVLVGQAVKDAPALAVARARIAASHAQVRQAEANDGPLLAATAAVDRQSVSENGFLGPFGKTIPALGTAGPWYTSGTVGLAGKYSFDVWGKESSRVAAAVGVENAARAEAAQAEMLLSTRVVRLYYDIQTLFGTIALLEQTRDIEVEAVAAHRAKAARGLEPRTPGEQALAHKVALDRQIVAAQGRIRTLREALRTAIGAGPDGLPEIGATSLPDASGPLPATLGFELLARRADLQAMNWYVQASLDQVDAAKAAFYPSFDIKGFVGFDALRLGELLHASSRQINLIPGLTLPLFDSGRLNANLAGTRAKSNVLIAQYNQAVLEAVREVAQSAIEVDSLQKQAALQTEQLKAAEFAAASADAHYRRGLADRVSALEAKLPALNEQSQALQLKHARVQADIALTSSLGGGYLARNDESTSTKE